MRALSSACTTARAVYLSLEWRCRAGGREALGRAAKELPGNALVSVNESLSIVRDQSLEGIAGIELGLDDELGELLPGLFFTDERVDDVLGLMVDTDEQTAFLSCDRDRLAVHAKEAAPSRRGELSRHLERRLGARSDLVDPGVEREVLLPVTIVAAAASFVVRFRASSGHRRQQLKWFSLAAGLAVAGFLTQIAAWGAATLAVGSDPWEITVVAAGLVVEIICLTAIPVASGVAILRYRLYDIDIIINRALVYASLTAVLALVYVAGVVVIGGIVRELTGQQENDIVVAASTLLVAALFRPARARIQGQVDKRFYRSRYDAQRTVEAFSTRLREEVDLDALSGELVAVVRSTMQPTQVSVWLKHSAP